jgi:hypothetical protein
VVVFLCVSLWLCSLCVAVSVVAVIFPDPLLEFAALYQSLESNLTIKITSFHLGVVWIDRPLMSSVCDEMCFI